MGRFDDVDYLGANGTVLSYNLFAYCSNNIINFIDPEGYASCKFIGAGIQIEIGIGFATIGIEIVWFFSNQVNVGGKSRATPYIYIYGGCGAELNNVVNNIIKRPSLLLNPKSLKGNFGLSVCVFAIFGYSNFKKPSDGIVNICAVEKSPKYDNWR